MRDQLEERKVGVRESGYLIVEVRDKAKIKLLTKGLGTKERM